MSNRETMQQALECIERCNKHGWILADYEDEVESAITALREALAQEQALKKLADLGQEIEQEPVAYYHPHKGFYWAKPTHISAPTVVDVPPVPLYTAPPAAQPPPKWVGLTEEELQFYRKKYSKLVNAGYDKMTDTNLVAKTFDNTGFYKEVSAVLKERNT